MRPYVKPNKNAARDAEAICEAVGRPSMRFVAVKSQAQEDMLALHRVRSLLVRERTALMNQMRFADACACEMMLVKSDGRLEAGEFVASVAASARSYKFTRGCPRRALGVMQF